MEISTREKRLFIFYEYSRGATAADAFENIRGVFGDASPALRTVYHWFDKFRNDNLDVDDAPRSGRPKEIDTALIRRKVEMNPTATTREPAEDIKDDQSGERSVGSSSGSVGAIDGDRRLQNPLSDSRVQYHASRRKCDPKLGRRTVPYARRQYDTTAAVSSSSSPPVLPLTLNVGTQNETTCCQPIKKEVMEATNEDDQKQAILEYGQNQEIKLEVLDEVDPSELVDETAITIKVELLDQDDQTLLGV